MLQNKSN